MKNKKPEIRFKGFSEDWEEKKLGEVVDLLTGYSFESKSFTESGIPLVRGMNVKRGYLDMSKNICEYWHSPNGLENYLLKENDVVIQMDGALIGKSYAKINEINLPALLVQRVTRVRSEKANSEFIYQCIQRNFLAYILSIKTETAVPHLSLNDIRNYQITTSQIDEQTQIGNFFKNLDNLITLHQRKCEKLGILKKAMLEKMFPKNGADVPEIRFKGFDGAWEKRTLGEMVQIKDSARVPKELWKEFGVRYFRSSDLENNGQGGELFISIEAYENYKSKTGVPESGDVLFNSGGDIGFSILKTDNTPVYVQGGAILYARTSQSKEVNGGYLNVYFSTPQMIKYIGLASAGGTIKHFTLKPANAAPFIFPNIIEQREISEFFVQLNKLLAIHQGELGKLKNLKKAMLEKMFV